MLLSLTEPTKGRVLRLGQPTADMSTLGQIGYMHEVHAYPQYLTPSSLLDYYGSLGLMEPETIHRRIPELLKMVGLWGQRDMPLSQFSKGMRQRAALAQALLNDPDLLIFDEPSEGLDLQGRQLIREVVSQRRKLGKSVFLISHILSEVEKLCDRVGVLTEGRLVYLGDISGLTTTPQGKVRPLEQAVRGFYETTPLESEQHAEVVG
jgi:ABC-2 type transport system ATP-binding protein